MSLEIYANTIQGRVAIGEKVTRKGTNTGKDVTFPTKLDYFIFTKPFDPKTKIAPKFDAMTKIMKEKYGTDKPKEIDVILVDHHFQETFFTDYMNYPGMSCNCRGDGKQAIRTDGEGKKHDIVCDYEHCEFRQVKGSNGIVNTCKPTGILTFLIPDAPIAGGVWKFTTHSNMSIGKIAGALRNIYSYRKTLYMLQVKLKVVMVTINKDGKTQNVPTVELEVPFSMPEIALGAGTALGTLEDIKKHFNITEAVTVNSRRMQELSTSSEELGNSGSAIDEAPIIDVQPEVSSFLEPSSDEFSF